MNASYDRVAEDPRPTPMLEHQALGFNNRATEILKLTSRLNEIANRTFGREGSTSEAKNGPVPVPGCSLSKLTDAGEGIDKAIGGLSRAIDRFENL